MLPEPLQVVGRLVRVFDRLEIAYLLGGSFASSIVGIERATQDIDFVVALTEGKVDAFAEALAEDFYVDGDRLREAIHRSSSANVLHLPTMVKVDLFVLADTSFGRSRMQRRLCLPLLGPDAPPVCIASAEDTILQKLHWFRLTGERSESQWRDVQGVLRVQGDALDFAYLSHWAVALDLTALLQLARADAGV